MPGESVDERRRPHAVAERRRHRDRHRHVSQHRRRSKIRRRTWSGSRPPRARAPSPRAQLDARPVMRAGEVLETVPGMIISQHSGEGKANQYYLRGFNLDHGTDFATTVAGVPVNTPTGAHAHGYADINFLIPELVSGVQFKKGPYFADEGDFSAAGAANINYVNQLERPMASPERRATTDGVACSAPPRRAWAAATCSARSKLNHNDGPWVRPDDYRRGQRRPPLQPRRQSQRLLRDGHGLLGGLGLHRPGRRARHRRAVSSSRFGFIDPTDAGQDESSERRGRAPALDRPVLDPRNRLSAAQQPEPLLELHLLPRRPRERRSVRAGRATDGGGRPRHLSAAGPLLRTAHRERHRRAAAARLARSGGPLSHSGTATALDDPRGPRSVRP